MADTISINTPNPRDITPEEAEDFANLIRQQNLNCDVKVNATEREGKGVTFFEIPRISLTCGALFGVGKAFGEEVAKKVADIAVEWARDRFRGRKKGSIRPVYVAIYGPDGVIKSVVVKNATDAPEDRTEQDQQTERLLSSRRAGDSRT